MTYVALAALLALAVHIATAMSLFHRIVRQHARERDTLINQILHLSGRTWTPPPVGLPPVEPVDDGRYVTAPEQLPEL